MLDAIFPPWNRALVQSLGSRRRLEEQLGRRELGEGMSADEPRIPRVGDILVARENLTLWVPCIDEKNHTTYSYSSVRDFEMGDAVIIVDIFFNTGIWRVFSDGNIYDYETPSVWDDDWDLIGSDEE